MENSGVGKVVESSDLLQNIEHKKLGQAYRCYHI